MIKMFLIPQCTMMAYKSTATREKYISARATPRFVKSPSTFTKPQRDLILQYLKREFEIKIAMRKIAICEN